GAAAYWIGTPLPWMLGPLFLTAVLCLAGAPLRPLKEARNFGQIIVGSSIGLQFTQAILLKLFLFTPLIVGSTLASTLIGALGALMLMRLTGLDRPRLSSPRRRAASSRWPTSRRATVHSSSRSRSCTPRA